MKIKQSWLAGWAGWLTGLGIRLLFGTLRLEVRLATEGTSPYDPTATERFLYCVWHDQILVGTFARRSPFAAALVSRHRDGAFLCGALKVMGMAQVRGSSSRGGSRAAREAFEVLQERHIAITPDGPRGPRREMKNGIIYLASRTGCRIAPTAAAAKRAWSPRGSWTDLMIPCPFSRTWLLIGEPFSVPPDLDHDGLEHYAGVLQRAMDSLCDQAARLADGQHVDDVSPRDGYRQTAA